MKCHNCGGEGHVSRECAWHTELTEPAADPGGTLKAQFKRCPACQAIIYAWDLGLPCDTHRIVADWQAYYNSGRFVTDSAATREHANRNRNQHPDRRQEAARQVAESRASRDLI